MAILRCCICGAEEESSEAMDYPVCERALCIAQGQKIGWALLLSSTLDDVLPFARIHWNCTGPVDMSWVNLAEIGHA